MINFNYSLSSLTTACLMTEFLIEKNIWEDTEKENLLKIEQIRKKLWNYGKNFDWSRGFYNGERQDGLGCCITRTNTEWINLFESIFQIAFSSLLRQYKMNEKIWKNRQKSNLWLITYPFLHNKIVALKENIYIYIYMIIFNLFLRVLFSFFIV